MRLLSVPDGRIRRQVTSNWNPFDAQVSDAPPPTVKLVISIFLCLTRSLGTLEECSRTLPETPG